MPDRPNASELIEAVFEFLADEVLPTADDQRLKFRTLVAMNALGIARRELESDAVSLDQGQLADLAARIRAGETVDLAELKEHVADEAPHLEPRLPREVRVRRRLYVMRHGAVSYFDARPAAEARGRAAHGRRARPGVRGRVDAARASTSTA